MAISVRDIESWKAKGKIGKIIDALESEDKDVTTAAVSAIAATGFPAIKPLLKKCNLFKLGIRRFAPAALSEMYRVTRDEAVFSAILDALDSKLDKKGWIHGVAAVALGKIGDARAVEPLLKRFGNGSCAEDADALGAIGDERAILPLLRASVDDIGYANDHAIDALVSFGASAFRSAMEMLTKSDKNHREGAAIALKRMVAAKKLPSERIAEFRIAYERDKPDLHYGGFNEPYCSTYCYRQAAQFINWKLDAIPVMTSCGVCHKNLIKPKEGKIGVIKYHDSEYYICEKCAPIARERFTKETNCAYCGRPLTV